MSAVDTEADITIASTDTALMPDICFRR